MSKMGSHDSFGHLKHKLWPKERPGVKLAVWLPTTKSRESTWFPCMQVACNIPLQRSWWGLQLCLVFISIWSLHTKLWAPKVVGVPTLVISGLPLGSLETNAIWMWASWRGIEYTIKGKVVAPPKFGSWWVLWVQVVRGSS